MLLENIFRIMRKTWKPNDCCCWFCCCICYFELPNKHINNNYALWWPQSANLTSCASCVSSLAFSAIFQAAAFAFAFASGINFVFDFKANANRQRQHVAESIAKCCQDLQIQRQRQREGDAETERERTFFGRIPLCRSARQCRRPFGALSRQCRFGFIFMSRQVQTGSSSESLPVTEVEAEAGRCKSFCLAGS